MMRKVSTLLIVLLAQAPSMSARADAVDDYVLSEMTQRRIPGLALAVIDQGRVVKQKAYGHANIELRAATDLRNSFMLASLTKVFTAAAVMKLVDGGRISLDDLVIDKLPELPPGWSRVTVRHCLDHVSGLPDVLDEFEQLRSTSRDGILRELAMLPVQAPGSHSRYNQTGFILLAMLIEKVSGQSLEDFVTHEVLEPAGMNDTRYADSRDVVAGKVTGYTTFVPSEDRKGLVWMAGMPLRSSAEIYTNYSTVPKLMHACGGLISTIADLIRFDLAIDAGSVISPQSLRATLSPVSLSDGMKSLYSLGWTVGNSRGWLPGSDQGFNFMAFGGANAVAFWRFPDERVTVIVLTNLQGSNPHTMALNIAEKYIGRSRRR